MKIKMIAKLLAKNLKKIPKETRRRYCKNSC